MRLGIYGGSFDPVHNAHLSIARACQQQAALDSVWFVPTAVQPLKLKGPHASNKQRLEMLRLAIAYEPTWRICTLEIDRGGLSYTVDTLRQIHNELPAAELFFLMGADALREVSLWREPEVIFELASALVVSRPGAAEVDLDALARFPHAVERSQLVALAPMDISSTEIRRRAAGGRPLDELVPPEVAKYIVERGVYRQGATS